MANFFFQPSNWIKIYYGGLSHELVAEVDEIHVFLHVRSEDVVLDKGGDGLVLVRADGDADGVS